jgi:hypothetical protein
VRASELEFTSSFAVYITPIKGYKIALKVSEIYEALISHINIK